jgi:hypothetical protein
VLLTIANTLLELAAVGLGLATLALAVQAAAAILVRDRSLPISSRRPSIAVLVPAHNEEQGIETTLLRIKQDLLPRDRLAVIADNCVDQTAAVARQAGAEVVIRNDPDRRGKGFALAAGLGHLGEEHPEVIIFVDADCQFSSHGVELLARACAATQAPVQGRDLMVASSDRKAPARLAEFAWRIKNDFRPAGYARLGLPCHLRGTGMAIPRGLIKPGLFETGHLAEDMLLGIELAIAGHPPRFFRGASVSSYFPETERGQAAQKQRWVQGHLGLIGTHLPRLIYHGVRRLDPGLLALAADLAVPPLGVLALANVVLLTLTVAHLAVTGSSAALGLAAVAAAAFLLPLLAAWLVCGQDLIGRREIGQVPRHVITVTRSVLNLARGQRTGWTRADRLQRTAQFGQRGQSD